MRIYSFFDVDGSSISVRELYRTRYPTHDEIRAVVIYCVPINKCEELLGKEVTILAVDLEDFVFNKIEIPRPFFRKDEVYIVSGTLKPHQGNLVFIYGLPYGILINRLSVEAKEPYYRELYLLSRAELLKAMNSLKEDLEKDIATIAGVAEQCKEIIKKYNDFIARTFGFVARGPEGLQAIEAALTLMEQALAKPAAPQVQAAGPSAGPSLGSRVRAALSRLLSAVRRLLGRPR